MFTRLSRVILALSVTLQLIAALPAQSDGTEETYRVYHALPNTGSGPATNALTTEPGLGVRPVPTATVTVTVTEGAFSILPVDPLTTRVTQSGPTGNLTGVGAGINTRRPPLAMSSLSGQPPEVVSEASVRHLPTKIRHPFGS